MNLFFRKCIQGEVQINNDSCKVCDNNTYSLNPNDLYCKPCPDSAVCYGTDQVYPASGYWRDINYPENFYQCVNTLACSQGKKNETSNCAATFQGNLCASCNAGYNLQGSYTCSACPQYWVSVTIVFIGICIIFALVAFLVYSNIKSVDKQKSDLALLLKIIVNYCQTVMLLAQIDLKWPDSILYILDFSKMLGDSSNQMLTFTCSIVNTDNENSFEPLFFSVYYPLIIGFASFILWGIVSIKRRSIRYIKVHFISTLIVIVFLVHTSISNSLLSLFSCKSINGIYWNTKDYTLKCFEGAHLDNLYKVGIPGLIVWVIIIPFIIFYCMFKNRKNLDEKDTKIKFKTLFAGYVENLYFWEFLIILRKFCMRLIAIILISSGITVQGLGIMIVLLLALVAHMQWNPFEKSDINRLEFYCIIIIMMYIAGGILFSTSISLDSKNIIGWLLFIMNIIFISYWSKFFFKAIFDILKTNSMLLKFKNRFFKFKSKKIESADNNRECNNMKIVNKSDISEENKIEPDQSLDEFFPKNPENSQEENRDYYPRIDAWTIRFQMD